MIVMVMMMKPPFGDSDGQDGHDYDDDTEGGVRDGLAAVDDSGGHGRGAHVQNICPKP